MLIALAATTLVGIGVAVGVVLSTAGGSDADGALASQSAPSDSTHRPGQANSSARAGARCTIYWQGRGAAIRVVSPEAAADCLSFIQLFGQRGEFWSTHVSCDSFGTGGDCENANRAQVCVAIVGEIIATVSDTGRGHRGRQICADLSGKGWAVTAGRPREL